MNSPISLATLSSQFQRSGLWRSLVAIFFSIVLMTGGSKSLAQNNGNGNGQGGGQNQNQSNAGGIAVDAAGSILPGFVSEPSSRLAKARMKALAAQQWPAELTTKSACRKVSLIELAKLLQTAPSLKSLPPEVTALAGLTRIDFLFLDPDHQDVILAGPAEGFAPDNAGLLRGIETGRPILQLDDLLVALRTLQNVDEVGCSIDPLPENLAALLRFIKIESQAASPQVIEGRFRKMAQLLGPQTVTVKGVPPDSHMARVFVAADYRMKRISQGLDPSGVKGLRSHLSMIGTGGNSLQRWWFVPYYEGLYRSADGLSFEMVGPRLQLMSQEELADAQGHRSPAATTRRTTQAFARQFTERFAALADESPIFGQLQGLTDWCVVAALIHQQRTAHPLAPEFEILLDAQRLPHQMYEVPLHVDTLVNARRVSSGMIVGLVGGGVTISVRSLLAREFQQENPAPRESVDRASALQHTRPAQHPWWWD